MAIKKGAEYERKIRPSEKKAIKKKVQQDQEEQAEQSTAASIDQFPDMAEIFDEMAIEYRGILVKMAELETRRKELSEILKVLVDDTGMKSIYGNGWRVVKCPGSNSGISKTKLLGLGVSMDVIEQATETVKYEYIQVKAGEVTNEAN